MALLYRETACDYGEGSVTRNIRISNTRGTIFSGNPYLCAGLRFTGKAESSIIPPRCLTAKRCSTASMKDPVKTAKATAFWELTKPGITRLVLVTTAAGFYLAGGASLSLFLMFNALLATAMVAAGTNALNQWVERDIDANMRRTAQRPLPSGRLSSREAFIFAWAISLFGLVYLAVFVNMLTAFVVGFTLSSYVFVYTPLKRKTWYSTLIGAVPGALPILAGWTATGRPVDAAAWALFAILFVWQMPHFFALAWIYREDYRNAGFQMLTVVDSTGARASWQALLYAAVLIPISLLPTIFGLTGVIYLVGALILGVAFLLPTILMLVRGPSEKFAWRTFIASIAYLPLLLFLMVIDKV
jgi:heme o synthase